MIAARIGEAAPACVALVDGDARKAALDPRSVGEYTDVAVREVKESGD
jgi:hypothetical protein